MRVLAQLRRFLGLIIALIMQVGLAGCHPFITLPNSPSQQSITNARVLSKISKNAKDSFFFKALFKKINAASSNQSGNIDEFWTSVQKDLQLTHYNHRAEVQEQITSLIARKHHLQATIRRSAKYIHYIYEQIKKRHLPAELVLLPLVESTYDPLALNHISGACGLWQLTSNTAKGFGIRQDWLFDGRRDIYTSTHAALDYLTYLNQFFSGDWLLSLAAYDTGEGNVQRAIRYNARKNLNITFWSLPLALETCYYVPRLLALSAIIKDPQKYNFILPNINNKPYLETVNVHAGISIIHAAELANISLKELKTVNPGFKQLVFMPNKPYRLLLPVKYATTFKKSLAQLPRKDFYSNLFYYTIRPGDNLISIAKRYNVKIEQLCLWNEWSSTKVLPINKKLIIKLSPTAVVPAFSQSIYHPSLKNPQIQSYTVLKGDTLWGIARELGLDVTDLQKWNNLSTTALKAGQKLEIKIAKNTARAKAKKLPVKPQKLSVKRIQKVR